MPTAEDLTFKMTIAPDTARMAESIRDIGKQVKAEADKMTAAWSRLGIESSNSFIASKNMVAGMSAASKAQEMLFDAARKAGEEAAVAASAWAKLGKESNAAYVAQDQFNKLLAAAAKPQNDFISAQKSVTGELEHQAQLLLEIKAATDPAILERRVALEREITKAREVYDKAADKEKKKQAGPESQGFDPKKLLEAFKGGEVLDVLKGLFSKGSGFDLSGLLKGKGGNKIPTVYPEGEIPTVQPAEASGGALGAAGGALGAAAEVLGPVAAAVAIAIGTVKKGLDAFASGLRELQGNLGPIGIFFNAIPIFGDALKDITSSLVAMTAKGSPAVFMQWQRALDDVQGVIGQTFIPVLQLMTDAVRTFGDVLATLLPTTAEMTELLKPLKAAWLELRDALKQIASDPFVKGFVWSQFMFWITAVSAAVRVLAFALQFLFGPLRGLSLLLGLNPNQPRSSVGAAAAPAQITSNEEFERQAQIAAYSQPANGPQEDPQLARLGTISGTLEDILGWLKAHDPTGFSSTPAGSGFVDAVTGGGNNGFLGGVVDGFLNSLRKGFT